MSPSVAVPPRRGYSGGEGGEGSCGCGVDEILLIELSATAAVNLPTVLADTWSKCRPCSTRGATSDLVVRPRLLSAPVGVLATIVDSVAPGDLVALGALLLCARSDALQLPARMSHVTWSRTRFNDALPPRDAVDDRRGCAQWLDDLKLATPATTAAPIKYVAAV